MNMWWLKHVFFSWSSLRDNVRRLVGLSVGQSAKSFKVQSSMKRVSFIDVEDVDEISNFNDIYLGKPS